MFPQEESGKKENEAGDGAGQKKDKSGNQAGQNEDEDKEDLMRDTEEWNGFLEGTVS